jgi:transposase-like protein
VFAYKPQNENNTQRARQAPSRFLGNPGGVSQSPRVDTVMADARRADRGMSCPRCTNAMDELLRIAPTAHDQGLIAYECSSCGYVTSVLVAPDGRRSG